MIKNNFGTLILSIVSMPAFQICVRASVARGDIACVWGINDTGELGNGTYDNRSFYEGSQPSPEPVNGLAAGVTAVTAGSQQAFAIQNGKVFSWGSGGNYQLGYTVNASPPFQLTPAPINAISGIVTAVGAGDIHTLFLKNGGVYACGDDQYGETGSGTLTTAIQALSTGVTAVAAGKDYSFAIKNGALYGWGANWHGQLGNGTTTNTLVPVLVTGLSSDVTAVSAGGSGISLNSGGNPDGTFYSYGAAIKNGALYTWGLNANGQLGVGNTTNTSTPALVTSLSSNVTSISAGSFGCLAVMNGSVYAWGDNHYGQLGDGTTTQELSPEEVDPRDLSSITSVVETDDSSYALASDGSLWVWGYNIYGQLGLGTNTIDYLTPQHLLPPSGEIYTSISGDAEATFALATLAPVPEPASLLLLAVGGLALLRRRLRRLI